MFSPFHIPRTVTVGTLIRRALALLAVSGVLAACAASSDGSTISSAPNASVEISGPQTAAESTPPEPVQNMSVDGALIVGGNFEVSFFGSLRESRGGYLWLQQPDGTHVALLRGDGNEEIPIGYDLDVADAIMLDDGLSGDISIFLLPPQLAPGQYTLCTANSADAACIEVDVVPT